MDGFIFISNFWWSQLLKSEIHEGQAPSFSLSLSPHRHAGQCRLLVSRHSLSLWSPTAFSHVVDPHPNRRAHVLSRGGTEKSPPNHVSPSREAVIIGSSSFRPVRFVRFVVNPGLRLWKQEKIRVRDVSCPQKKGKKQQTKRWFGHRALGMGRVPSNPDPCQFIFIRPKPNLSSSKPRAYVMGQARARYGDISNFKQTLLFLSIYIPI